MEPHSETVTAEELRDRFEVALARAARARRLPTLGICRGMQLLNVVYGGDLEQHLADVVDPLPHRPGPGQFGDHPVAVAEGTATGDMLGDAVSVRSTHHQGVRRVGDGLVVAGRAPDGTVEAIEDPPSPFCVGVLWHPEEQAGTGGARRCSGAGRGRARLSRRATVQSR